MKTAILGCAEVNILPNWHEKTLKFIDKCSAPVF
jgi:hypothetical protein